MRLDPRICQQAQNSDFEYIHPIIRITAMDPPLSWVKSVKVIHIICAPERAIDIVTQWRARADCAPAKFVWEPLPWACLPKVSQE